jgi:hypothetical protein
MKFTEFRERLQAYAESVQAYAVWSPVVFSAGLGVITLVMYVRNPNAWAIPFISFQTMAFYFVAASHNQTRERIKVLEGRIQQLEADKAVAF